MSLAALRPQHSSPSALPPKGVPLRAPKHPGKLLAQLCLKPLSLNQSEAARLLGLSRRRLHELVHGQRAMSPDTAIRCARQFGIDASFLLSQQAAWDSFQAWKRLQAASAAATAAAAPLEDDADQDAPAAHVTQAPARAVPVNSSPVTP